MGDVRLVKCRACGHEIASSAWRCPQCGQVGEWTAKLKSQSMFAKGLLVAAIVGWFMAEDVTLKLVLVAAMPVLLIWYVWVGVLLWGRK